MWIDYDDGHAGGYPHDCPTTEECRDCGRTIVVKYPDAPEHLKWGHVSREAAQACPVRGWPMPRNLT